MSHKRRLMVARRWLLPALALLLVLGHACELPALAAVASPHVEERSAHAHGAASDGHGHEHDSALSCDPVDAASASTTAPPGGSRSALLALPHPTAPVGLRQAGQAPDHRWRPPERPPLFLLHAALLI